LRLLGIGDYLLANWYKPQFRAGVMATMPCNALHIAHAPWGGTYISITLPQLVAGVCNENPNTPSMPHGADALYIFNLPHGARQENPDQIFDTPSRPHGDAMFLIIMSPHGFLGEPAPIRQI